MMGAFFRMARAREMRWRSPVYEEFLKRYREQGEASYNQLNAYGMEPMWESSRDTMGLFIEYIYDHLDEFRLLIACSEQSPYERFTHLLIELDIELTQRYLNNAQRLGFKVNSVSNEEMHILTNAQFSCIFEMVLHDIPKQTALKIARKLSGFFAAGWKDILVE